MQDIYDFLMIFYTMNILLGVDFMVFFAHLL